MKGSIRPWGADLSAALGALTGELSLILVGHGPLEYYPAAPAAEQVARVQAATGRWGGSLEFHLWSADVEYRWDHGAGTELAVGAEGDYELVERTVLLAQELSRAPGGAAVLKSAPTGRLKVREFALGGSAVDLKIEGLA